jgi:DNA-binding PadR family transcriptional regulator
MPGSEVTQMGELGDMPTLSRKEAVILEMLIGNREMFGLQMVQGSGGRLLRGTVYVTLSRMEDKGYVESRQEEPDPACIGLPRRLYRATGLGRRVFDAMELARTHFARGVLA